MIKSIDLELGMSVQTTSFVYSSIKGTFLLELVIKNFIKQVPVDELESDCTHSSYLHILTSGYFELLQMHINVVI